MTRVVRSVEDPQLRSDTIRLQSKHRKRLQRALEKVQPGNNESMEQVRVRKRVDYHTVYAQLLTCHSSKYPWTLGLIVAKMKIREDLLNAAISRVGSTNGAQNDIAHKQHKPWMDTETEVIERCTRLTNSQPLGRRGLIASVNLRVRLTPVSVKRVARPWWLMKTLKMSSARRSLNISKRFKRTRDGTRVKRQRASRSCFKPVKRFVLGPERSLLLRSERGNTDELVIQQPSSGLVTNIGEGIGELNGKLKRRRPSKA